MGCLGDQIDVTYTLECPEPQDVTGVPSDVKTYLDG